MDYGVLTLIPPILAITMAIISKRTIESLLLGALTSYMIVGGFNFLPMTVDALFETITDYDNAWLILVCGLFGSLIALLNSSKATYAASKLIGKFCKGEKSTLIVSWIMGIIIFIDDYMNILTISACTRKLCDDRKIPRESLAYVIDSTGAPTCVLLPFSTWAIFFAGVFYEYDAVKALGLGTAIQTYTHVIPFVFYAIIALAIVPMFIMGILPKLGAMKAAYDRTATTGMVYGKGSEYLNRIKEDAEVNDASIADFLVPVVAMILISTIQGDMFLALIVAILLCAIMYIPRKKIKASEFCDLWVQGFADTIPALAIIVAALLMRKAATDLNLPGYVVGLVEPYMNAKTFPFFAFIIVSVLGFVTGSNWGTPAVCAAIIIPLGAAINANMLLVMGAIVSGGTFCSHACFYSDATVITSTACGIENMDHVKTQMPYAMLGFAISCVGYLLAGFLF